MMIVISTEAMDADAKNFIYLSNGKYDVATSHRVPFEERENTSENNTGGDDSLPSTTPTNTSISSPKRRRSIQKRVVTVPIKEIDGGRFSKGDYTTPLSDSWAWRKYGQKPIKGSPYPRAYYRCSSSKGCPARKQVERNRLEPTMLVITYSYGHNHSFPVSRNHHHHNNHPAATSAQSPPPAKPTTVVTTNIPHDASPKSEEADPTTISIPNSNNSNNINYDQSSTDGSLRDAKFADLAGEESLITTDEFTWAAFSEMDTSTSTTASFSSMTFLGSTTDAELARYYCPTRKEDEYYSLFSDLEELPECSFVFGRRAAPEEEEEERRRRNCNLAAAPWCGTTGC